MHQLPNQGITHDENKIIVELIPGKVFLTHVYDEDGNNHVYLKVENRETELMNDEDIKNIFKDNYVTLEDASKVLEDNMAKGLSTLEI